MNFQKAECNDGFSPILRGAKLTFVLWMIWKVPRSTVIVGIVPILPPVDAGSVGHARMATGPRSFIVLQMSPLILNIVLVVLAVGFVLLMLAMSSTALKIQVESDSTVIHYSQAAQKILLNHVQLISLGSGFPLKWPDQVMSMFEIFLVSNAGATPSIHLASGWSLLKASMFFQKQLGILILPFVVVWLCAMYWGYRHCQNKCCPADKRWERRQRKLMKKRARKIRYSKKKY